MSQEKTMSDVIVDEIRRLREELINRHGGIDGYFKYDHRWPNPYAIFLATCGKLFPNGK
jgi:hypothetical protein